MVLVLSLCGVFFVVRALCWMFSFLLGFEGECSVASRLVGYRRVRGVGSVIRRGFGGI